MRIIYSILIGALILASCQNPVKTNQNQITFSDEFLSSAVIYEANIRQFTEEGTFAAFQDYIPSAITWCRHHLVNAHTPYWGT